MASRNRKKGGMAMEAPELYNGLDQLIAKPTKEDPVTAPQEEPAPPAESPALLDDRPHVNQTGEQAHSSDGEGNLVRRLEPDLPDAPDLYRKQTLQFGPKELDAIRTMQQGMSERHNQTLSKNDLVRAAVEFLAKDFAMHKDASFLARKFVRR